MKNLRPWLKAAIATTITGGSSALASSIALDIAHAADSHVPTLNWKAWLIVFAVAGGHNLLTYLAQSPLPPAEDAPAPAK